MRGSKVVAILAVFALVFSLGMAEDSTEGEGKKKKKRSGARKGAILGGATGLALGALTGDASLAAKGAAAGAVTGAASGAWYDYDQQNQDDRTEMHGTTPELGEHLGLNFDVLDVGGVLGRLDGFDDLIELNADALA